MYWTDWGDNPKIERAAFDGSGRQVLANRSMDLPNDLALDLQRGKLYWVDGRAMGKIEVMNLDGSERQVLLQGSNSDGMHIFGLARLRESLVIVLR